MTTTCLDQYERAELALQLLEHDVRKGEISIGPALVLGYLGIGRGRPVADVLAELRAMLRRRAVEEVTS